MNKIGFLAILILLTFSGLISCSLKYDQSPESEENTPELAFVNAVMNRYEGGLHRVQVTASKMEQYKIGSATFAQDVTWITWNKNQMPDTTGKCGLLGAYQDKGIYSLFDGIEIFNSDQKMHITANSLMWNEKSEQLVSTMNSPVTIRRDDLEISGWGFAASGVDKSFRFNATVSGTITQNQTPNGQQPNEPQPEKQ